MVSMRTDTIRFLTLEETTRLLNGLASHRRDKAIFLLAYRHGLRASEVGLLRVEDLYFKTLRIMIHRLKGSHSGEHPLQADEAKAIKTYLRERRSDSPILSPVIGVIRSLVAPWIQGREIVAPLRLYFQSGRSIQAGLFL
jgi:integrase